MSNKLSVHKQSILITDKSTKVIADKRPTLITDGKVVNSDNQVDLVFVFDTTGSMDDKIKALKQTCMLFVDEANNLDLDIQFALISFGDIKVEGGGDTIEVVVSPTSNIEKIKHGLTHIPRNSGFGNDGESSMEAIREALKLSYRTQTVRVLVLITDEPAHQHNITAPQMTATLTEREFLVFVIAPPFRYYKEMALKNKGIWKEVGISTNLSEILDIFKEVAKKVSEVVEDVHRLAGGSVSEYHRLKPPKET